MNSRVGIVVPTLGTRPKYLRECLHSIRLAGPCHINLVAPPDFDPEHLLRERLIDQITLDPASGLSEAINRGIDSLPEQIEFVNWLGDDDLLHPGTFQRLQSELINPGVVLVYGDCDYVNADNRVIWSSPSGKFASGILRFGPDLIPQPGALFRREAFQATGGLSSKFGLAFDFDLLIKLSKIGRLKYLPFTVASFRWHNESLTVSSRWKSVAEASKVRRSHLPPILKPASFIWELPVVATTYLAGLMVSQLAKRDSLRIKS